MLNITDETKNVYLQDGIHKSMRIYFPDLDMTFTNERIVSGTFSLTESIQSSGNLEFIGCIASNLSVTLADLTVDVKGQKIEVYVKAGDTEEIPLFHGVVDSAQKQSYKNHKEIIAYDILYTLSQTDVATWYNNHRKTTITELFTDLMEYVGVEVDNVTWINGHLPAYCAESQIAESLAALDIVKSICQINGVFGRINRAGKFETISINTNADVAFNIEDHENMEHEEFAVKPINSVVIRESNSDGGTEAGGGDNKYIIQGNMFTVDWTSDELAQAVENIYNAVSNVTYIPFEADTYGLPFIECGDQVIFEDVDLSDFTSTKKYFFVYSRTLKNVNGMRDSFTAEGEEMYSEFSSDVSTDVKSIKSQMGEYNLIRFMYKNYREISIADIETFLFEIKYTTKMSRPIFLAEIVVDVVPDTETKTIPAIINGTASTMEYTVDKPVEVSFRYTLNEAEIDYHPVETLTAGKHIINLMYVLGDLAGSGSFVVYMTANGGKVNIGESDIIATIFAQGKATAAVEWDGVIKVEENVPRIAINNPKITVNSIRDEMSVDVVDPRVNNMTERIGLIDIGRPKMIINSLRDVIELGTTEFAYTINTSAAKYYSYDKTAVDISSGIFTLNTNHSVTGGEEPIEQGRMTTLYIDTEAFASIDSMEVSLNG